MLRTYLKQFVSRIRTNDYQTLNRIELSRANVLHNIALIQEQHPGYSIFPVLKSNAYGHGLTELAKILNEATCDFLVVDGYFEAAKIRTITKHRILVMGYIRPHNTKLLDTKRCSFVVQDIDSLKAFGRLGRPVRIHVELNTGMNRMGLQPHELGPYLEIFKQYPNLELEGIMSHLADADNDQDNTFTEQQTTCFDALVSQVQAAGFKPKYIHLAQTAGSTKTKSTFANSIRLGIGVYGINPLAPTDPLYNKLKALKPALSLTSTIVKIIDLQKGDKVSYNGIFTAPRAMRIGVLPLGYYEGIPRELSNAGVVTLDGTLLPIVGRVCMNHTMISLEKTNAQVGDEVIVIDNNPEAPNSVEQICLRHTLFPYALLTGLSSSIRRVII